jgi:2-octaprenyl-6-methoxyphenol hydroxylase
LVETVDTDIAVVGAGPAGLAAALALAREDARVALIGPAPPPRSQQFLDTRTAALLASSVDMLKALGVFEALLPQAAPLKAIRIIDASGSLLRAPDLEFRASELELEAFGYNIVNSALVEALYARAVATLPQLQPSNVERIEFSPTKAMLRGGYRHELHTSSAASGRLDRAASARWLDHDGAAHRRAWVERDLD